MKIRNDRQLARTRSQVREFTSAAEGLDGVDRATYLDLVRELEEQIAEYVSVRDGRQRIFPIHSLDRIADALVKARIARRWTQAELTEAVGVSEQMVQRDEAGSYERAGLSRLADTADVLGYELNGVLMPKEMSPVIVTGDLLTEWIVPPRFSETTATRQGDEVVESTSYTVSRRVA